MKEEPEGLEDEIEGLTKTVVFGKVAYVRRQAVPYDDAGRTVLWIAMRVGNIPLGVEFRARGGWGIFDVVEEDQARRLASRSTSSTDQLDSTGSSAG